jgi:hypothetical protein
MNHPREIDLALQAGGESGRIRRFLLDRHVRTCADCREKVAEYQQLRIDLANVELPDLNWNFLAADMRANIRLGLEAGACVRTEPVPGRWNPRPVIAFASLLLLIGAGEFLRDARPPRPVVVNAGTAVLESTESGVEIRTATNSLTLLNHHGNAANQTVSAQGDIGARYIDGDTGSVTINNVYLQ